MPLALPVERLGIAVSLEPPVARLSVQFVTVIDKEDETELLLVVQEYVDTADDNKKKL